MSARPAPPARPEPTYHPVEDEAGAGPAGSAAAPKIQLADILEKANGGTELAKLIEELSKKIAEDPKAEATASMKMWRPGAVVGRDAAILIVQKASSAKSASLFVLMVGAYLERFYGFQATELYAEGNPAGPAASNGARPAGSGGRPAAGGGGNAKYPKLQPGVWPVQSCKLILIEGTEYLEVTGPDGRSTAKTKVTFLEKQGMDFSAWEKKVAYGPAPEMAQVKVEQEGFIAGFVAA